MQARLKGLSPGYYRVAVGRKVGTGTTWTSFVAGPATSATDGVAVGTPGAP